MGLRVARHPPPARSIDRRGPPGTLRIALLVPLFIAACGIGASSPSAEPPPPTRFATDSAGPATPGSAASSRAPTTPEPATPTPAPVVQATPTPAPPPVSGGSDLVQLTNVKRAGEGRPPLAGSALLATIAAERASAMASRDRLFHDLEYVVQRLTGLGACYTLYAEVIASESGYGSFSAQRTVDAWWASAEHHAILAGDFGSAGGAWAQARSGTFYAVIVLATLC